MFKKIGIFALILSFIILAQDKSFAFWFKKKAQSVPVSEAVFAPVNNVDDNQIWVGTFQLVWNDLQNEVIKAPIEFVGEKSALAQALNKQGFTTSMISDSSYYKKYGKTSLKLKKEIENGIKKKFNEKSDILSGVNWNSGELLIYAMLKKDFEYLKEFKKLQNDSFEGEKVKFFGIDAPNKDNAARKNVEVLFYENGNSYAVKLFTKNNEEVYLYRTNDNKPLEEYLKDLNTKTANFKGEKTFTDEDLIKIPYINFDKRFQYPELCDRPIIGTDYMIDEAIQTVKFKMDNKGGSLKSEAALMVKMSLMPMGRAFYFNKPFVLFLKEKNQQTPYFIVSFKNAALFEKP